MRETARVLLAAALAHDPGLEARAAGWGVLGDRLIEAVVAGRRFSNLLQASLGLARPLVAIGAPVGAYYPEVARALGAPLSIPDACRRSATPWAPSRASCRRPSRFWSISRRSRCFEFTIPRAAATIPSPSPRSSMRSASRALLALAAARRAGAADPHVDTEVIEKRAQVGPGTDYLAEALVRVARPSGQAASYRINACRPGRHIEKSIAVRAE